jgi:hypothetical protein
MVALDVFLALLIAIPCCPQPDLRTRLPLAELDRQPAGTAEPRARTPSWVTAPVVCAQPRVLRRQSYGLGLLGWPSSQEYRQEPAPENVRSRDLRAVSGC